jgi:phosphatidylserine/phosphatidylglycerophosphate/cardiolipin synthase-like enzyme
MLGIRIELMLRQSVLTQSLQQGFESRSRWLLQIMGVTFILVFLFLDTSCLGFPAKDVQVITDRQYFAVVRDCFREAKSSIRMMMYEASYYKKYQDSPSNILIRELIAAKKRGLEVKVILERREEKEKEAQKNRGTGALLAQGGVEVAYDPLSVVTHTKLLLIDGKISVVGSTNWTYSALEKNHEAAGLIRSPEVASNLQNYFRDVWKTCSKGK